ncbi:MAG: NADH-quinone oxidoreductase subunit NuoE [Hyphomicrobium sp.]
MTVRRLHSEQPPSFTFNSANLAWAKAQLDKYPAGRQVSAVIPLLWRAQEQEGWLTEPAMRVVADMLAMPYIRAYEIATFYTMFQLAPVGSKAHVQVCGTTPCMLRGAPELIALCKSRIAEAPHKLSADGTLSWEEVECLGSCANAPMVQIGSDTFEDLDAERLETVINGFANGRRPKPGSQIGRVASCPSSGPTTLVEYSGGAGKALLPAVAVAASVTFGSRPAPRAESKNDGEVGSGFATRHVVVGDEAVGDMLRPILLAEPRGGKADDLKLIWGIGPMLEKALNKLGIWHFEQIAGWSLQNIKWIDQNLEDFRGRVERDKWIEQARKLAAGWRPSTLAGEKPRG